MDTEMLKRQHREVMTLAKYIAEQINHGTVEGCGFGEDRKNRNCILMD